MSPEDYCREKASPLGSNLYYCLLYQTEQSKRALRALFAFEYELQQIIANNTDPGVTRIKLQWWLDEIEKISTAQSRHPIGIELQSIIKPGNLDKKLLVEYVGAIELHIQATAVEDYESWLRVFGLGKGLIWEAAAAISNCEDSTSHQVSKETGKIIAISDILQNLPRYLHWGLCPLPEKEMQQHGVTANMLEPNRHDESVRALFSSLVAQLISDLEKLESDLPVHDKDKMIFCQVAIRLTSTLCRKIQSDNYRLLEKRVIITPLRKLWIAWRTK